MALESALQQLTLYQESSPKRSWLKSKLKAIGDVSEWRTQLKLSNWQSSNRKSQYILPTERQSTQQLGAQALLHCHEITVLVAAAISTFVELNRSSGPAGVGD